MIRKSFCLKHLLIALSLYSKTYVKGNSQKDRKLVFKTNHLSLNAGQKYCRMLQREHSAILSTYIKLACVFMIFVLSF